MNQEEQRPLVIFEIRPIEDRDATIKAGTPRYRDIEHLTIVPPGGGNMKWEGEVTDAHRERFRPEYEAFKRNEEAPTVGSPLKLWPPATPSIIKTLSGMNIKTVEQLGSADEATLGRIGMGARDWKRKAETWLKEADAHGAVTQEVAALHIKVEALETRNATLESDNKALQAELEEAGATKPRRGRRAA